MKTRSFFLFFLFLPATAFSWSPSTTQRIATKGAELAPADLRLLISRYRSDYDRGLTRAQNTEGAHPHFARGAVDRGGLRTELTRQIAEAIALMKGRKPIAQFVEKLGIIAHFTADMNNPFHVVEPDGRMKELQPDFESYLDRRTAVIPTVYYGLMLPFDPSVYFRTTIERSRSYYPLLVEEYYRGERRRSSAEFDDRSTAFGIVSLSYSHAVTDLVNVYYYIWKEAGGNVRDSSAMRRGTVLLNEPTLLQGGPASRPLPR